MTTSYNLRDSLPWSIVCGRLNEINKNHSGDILLDVWHRTVMDSCNFDDECTRSIMYLFSHTIAKQMVDLNTDIQIISDRMQSEIMKSDMLYESRQWSKFEYNAMNRSMTVSARSIKHWYMFLLGCARLMIDQKPVPGVDGSHYYGPMDQSWMWNFKLRDIYDFDHVKAVGESGNIAASPECLEPLMRSIAVYP